MDYIYIYDAWQGLLRKGALVSIDSNGLTVLITIGNGGTLPYSIIYVNICMNSTSSVVD